MGKTRQNIPEFLYKTNFIRKNVRKQRSQGPSGRKKTVPRQQDPNPAPDTTQETPATGAFETGGGHRGRGRRGNGSGSFGQQHALRAATEWGVRTRRGYSPDTLRGAPAEVSRVF